MECANLWDIHAKYFAVSSVRELFENADNHSVIHFIREPHFVTSCNVYFFNFVLALYLGF